jgi:hypothetical protein
LEWGDMDSFEAISKMSSENKHQSQPCEEVESLK